VQFSRNFQLSTFNFQPLNIAVPILGYAVIAMAAYLLGSIPTGYLAGCARGIDIRAVGSGNMGAANVFRTLGKTAGVIVLVVDGLKGYAACAWLCDEALGLMKLPTADAELYRIIAGISAVLGHNFTCWLKFKGGKGIATSAGVFFALAPLAVGIALGAWIIVFALSRYVSVASIAAAVALPATVWLTPNSLTLQIVTTALGLLAIAKHKSNIERLFNGTERRFGKKTATPEATK
jgi:glycerol-3-phosphate acyltransferase PlsY